MRTFIFSDTIHYSLRATPLLRVQTGSSNSTFQGTGS
jgi:hypothetical protein